MSADGARPIWPAEQLAALFSALYGNSRRGGPDTQAAAQALGVSRRQVQRWLSVKKSTPMPAHRFTALRQATAPDDAIRRQEAVTADYARKASTAIARRRGVLPAWRTQRWTEPHDVTVVRLPQLGLYRAAISRAEGRPAKDLPGRGDIIDQTTVGNRFAAQVLKAELLAQVDAWRVQAPRDLVPKGHAETWLSTAPRPRLDQLAKHLKLAGTKPPAKSKPSR